MTAVLLDDETDSLNLLELQLRRHCPEIKNIHAFSDPEEALRQLPVINPHILFTDIEMPGIDGFGVLERLNPLPSSVIFITAYNQYAIKAFRYNALDYLVKPVDEEQLVQAVAKAIAVSNVSLKQITEAKHLASGQLANKLAVPSAQGLTFVSLTDILMAEANNHYSKLLLTDGRSHLLSKTMKEVQEILEEGDFFRIHRQFIINLQHVRHFNKNDNIITMMNNVELPVARTTRDALIDRFRVL